MKRLSILFIVFMLLPFSKCHALLITHLHHIDNQISGTHGFSFSMISQGYNPVTDVINKVVFTYDIKEIIEDPFEDTPDMDEREFATIFDHFLYYRGIFPDLDTGVFSERLSWTRQEECRFSVYVGDEEVCHFKPDQDGMFYSYWNVESENLWMNSISLTIDVTRRTVSEPSSLLLLYGIFPFLVLRFGKYRMTSRKTI